VRFKNRWRLRFCFFSLTVDLAGFQNYVFSRLSCIFELSRWSINSAHPIPTGFVYLSARAFVSDVGCHSTDVLLSPADFSFAFIFQAIFLTDTNEQQLWNWITKTS
jgi:hypothetical protein